MDFPSYRKHIQNTQFGKQLPDAVYLHKSALEKLPAEVAALVQRVAQALKIPDEQWNVLKCSKRDFKISYLHYPDFEIYAYPSLHECFTVDLSKLSLRRSDYSQSDNPPILHRKETFVLPSHPLHHQFAEITAEGEEVGLYENSRSIGFKTSWERLIRAKGLKLSPEGRLLETGIEPPKSQGAESAPQGVDVEIFRHRTAIDRNQLSQPMQILARLDYLNGKYSLLDYGCGKGDDLRELEAHGIDATGWDPVFHPEGELIQSDIVNLGFVLNVIDDRAERDETLLRAWGLAEKALLVSVMIAGDSVISQFTPYKDGVLTSRNTFQKYYSQGEFRSYLERVLQESAIAVGQGIFLVFKDKLEEQNFLLERQHIRRDWRQKTERIKRQALQTQRPDLIERHSVLFDDFWQACLDLGRTPANDEFENSPQIRKVAGSHAKATEILIAKYGDELLQEAGKRRKEDLLVYFALGLFGRRKPRAHMPSGLLRDVKEFFGSLDIAMELATQALFRVGRNEVIANACNEAYSRLQHGEMIEGHSYIFHKDRLGDMPTDLRIFIGCATQLYGDLSNIHLIKAHMTSGKVSLMRYDDWEKSEPLLTERIKIKLREQEVDYFEYGTKFESTRLTNRNLFS